MNIIYTKCFDTQIQQNNDVQMQKITIYKTVEYLCQGRLLLL